MVTLHKATSSLIMPPVLQTSVRGSVQFFNTLSGYACPLHTVAVRKVCVLKQTGYQFALIRTVFTHLRYRHRLIIPVAAHINSRCLECQQARVAYHTYYAEKQKTLGLSILGSLEFCGVLFTLHLDLRRPQNLGCTITNQIKG
jgi:hypothetical protein